jgi:hypothetical protein
MVYPKFWFRKSVCLRLLEALYTARGGDGDDTLAERARLRRRTLLRVTRGDADWADGSDAFVASV